MRKGEERVCGCVGVCVYVGGWVWVCVGGCVGVGVGVGVTRNKGNCIVGWSIIYMDG